MKNVLNIMSIKFESRSVNESFARQTVAAFIAQLDPTLDELGDLKTALSEAVTNAIVHAYADKLGYITVSVKIQEDRQVEIKVKDSGRGIANVNEARQPLFTTGDDSRSGMGFTIMESFMDKVRVRSAAGRGTIITMQKTLTARGTEP